jgi:hypothetical protein
VGDRARACRDFVEMGFARSVAGRFEKLSKTAFDNFRETAVPLGEE